MKTASRDSQILIQYRFSGTWQYASTERATEKNWQKILARMRASYPDTQYRAVRRTEVIEILKP